MRGLVVVLMVLVGQFSWAGDETYVFDAFRIGQFRCYYYRSDVFLDLNVYESKTRSKRFASRWFPSLDECQAQLVKCTSLLNRANAADKKVAIEIDADGNLGNFRLATEEESDQGEEQDKP